MLLANNRTGSWILMDGDYVLGSGRCNIIWFTTHSVSQREKYGMWKYYHGAFTDHYCHYNCSKCTAKNASISIFVLFSSKHTVYLIILWSKKNTWEAKSHNMNCFHIRLFFLLQSNWWFLMIKRKLKFAVWVKKWTLKQRKRGQCCLTLFSVFDWLCNE